MILIQDINPEDESVPQSPQPTSTDCFSSHVSSLFSYTTSVVNRNAVTFLDSNFLSFALPDFDEVTKTLHVGYIYKLMYMDLLTFKNNNNINLVSLKCFYYNNIIII